MNLYGNALLASDTSHAAKVSMEPHLNRLETVILEHLQIHGPRNCDAMEAELELRHSTVSARLTSLRDKGKIYDCGRAKTRSGRSAVVWGLRC